MNFKIFLLIVSISFSCAQVPKRAVIPGAVQAEHADDRIERYENDNSYYQEPISHTAPHQHSHHHAQPQHPQQHFQAHPRQHQQPGPRHRLSQPRPNPNQRAVIHGHQQNINFEQHHESQPLPPQHHQPRPQSIPDQPHRPHKNQPGPRPLSPERRRQLEEDEREREEEAKSAYYTFDSSVMDSINDQLNTRSETRDGKALTGMYSYSDGYFKRTVYYRADENGYRVEKEEVEPIGDGPQFNPDGRADVSSSLIGSYSVTADDFRKDSRFDYEPRRN